MQSSPETVIVRCLECGTPGEALASRMPLPRRLRYCDSCRPNYDTLRKIHRKAGKAAMLQARRAMRATPFQTVDQLPLEAQERLAAAVSEAE